MRTSGGALLGEICFFKAVSVEGFVSFFSLKKRKITGNCCSITVRTPENKAGQKRWTETPYGILLTDTSPGILDIL